MTKAFCKYNHDTNIAFTLAECATHVVRSDSTGKFAFTKPSVGTSDSERRQIIIGNRAAWLSAFNEFASFASQNCATLSRQSAKRQRSKSNRKARFSIMICRLSLSLVPLLGLSETLATRELRPPPLNNS